MKDSKRRARSSGVVVPHSLNRPGRLAAALIYGSIRAVASTLRFRCTDESGFLGDPARRAIYCTWHNRLALGLEVYNRFVQPARANRRLAALVSASKDGGLLARILELFSVQPVRGSSSRRGSQAILELTTWAERGYDIAITPDGPRGPCYVVQEGVIALAQLTRRPIIPMTYQLTPKVQLKSWDRFQVPIPFGRCVVHFGRPLLVPESADDTERASLRQILEDQMRQQTRD